jgi:hypothetical protein
VIQILPGYKALGLQAPRSANVAPGKEVELYEWSFDLRPQGESGNKGSLTIHGSGKFSLQCERIVGPTMANPNHPNPAMSKLATGKLELDVKEEVKAPKEGQPKAPQKQEKGDDATKPKVKDETEKILEEVRKLGGKVELDEMAAGKPVIFIKLNDIPVEDAFVIRVASIATLRKLHLASTKAGDEALKSVGKMKELEHLDLAFAPVTDSGLKHLHSLKNLKRVRLSFTKVTDDGVAELQKALPETTIIVK